MAETTREISRYVKYGVIIPTTLWAAVQLGRFGLCADFNPNFALFHNEPEIHSTLDIQPPASGLIAALEQGYELPRNNLHENPESINEAGLRKNLFSGQKSLQHDSLNEVKDILSTRNNLYSKVVGNKEIPVRNKVMELEDTISDLTQYDDYITEACKEFNVDKMMAYAVIRRESQSDPRAISDTGAAGLLQLTTATARELGLRVDSVIDERLDPEKAIDAGIRYLKKLQDMFGKQHLVHIAWNYGMGNTMKLKKYWGNVAQLYMHIPDKRKREEVKIHVKKILATEYLLAKKDEYRLNIDKKPLYSERIRNTSTHIVKKGNTLYSIANKYGMKTDELKKINPRIKKFSMIMPGMQIRVY